MTAASDAEDRRLATLHLRLGGLAIARAELEEQQGRGALDTAGLADLAEARWRTGSLDLAAAAAADHLSAGGSRPIAQIIAAEAAAARGDPMAARAHVEALGNLPPGALDHLFAGMPRRPIWSAGTAASPARSGAQDGNPPGPAEPDHRKAPGRRRARGPETVPGDPSAEFARARDEIGSRVAADVERGLARLSLVLRVAPDRAVEVLDAIERSGQRREATAQIVRGDACRLLGRHLEAEAAYASAATALAATVPGRAS